MGESILIVDDEAVVTLALEGFFQTKGYKVVRAFYGDQALAAIDKVKPALIILDLQMPGLDGIAVLEKVRRSSPEIKTLVVTGFTHQYQKELERLKPDAVRIKPISLEDLLSAVEHLLHKKDSKETARKSEASGKIKVLFVAGNEKLYLDEVKPHFEKADRESTYTITFAPSPAEAFRLLTEFRPHIVVLDGARLPVGVEAGKLAADMAASPRGPIEVILHSISPDASGREASLTSQFDRLDEMLEQVAKRHQLLPISHGG